jgi:hypothetical protein
VRGGFDAKFFRRQLEDKLRNAAAAADAGYPDNEGLVIDPETGIPSLKAHRADGQRPSAKRLEQEIKARMPERSLMGIVARTAYWVEWWRRFGPPSGNEHKLTDPLGRYVIVTFVKGTNMGPYEAARHIPGVSGHELSYVANRHFSIVLLNEAVADLVNAHARLDISQAWGDGTAVAADGTHMDTNLDNLLSETSVRYGKPGGIAYHHISDTYIALFTHFIPCGVWEAVYIIEGLLKNTSEVKPTTVHADTQGQSFPVFALAHLLGFDLMPSRGPRVQQFRRVVEGELEGRMGSLSSSASSCWLFEAIEHPIAGFHKRSLTAEVAYPSDIAQTAVANDHRCWRRRRKMTGRSKRCSRRFSKTISAADSGDARRWLSCSY